jgi:hypothetical protein
MPNPSGKRARRIANSAAPVASSHHADRRLYTAGLILIAIAIAAAGFAIWDLRRDRVAEEAKDTKNLAVVLAAQTAVSFQAIDLVLHETEAMVQASGTADSEAFKQRMATEEVHRFLVERLHTLPQVDAISLIDNAGSHINSSRSWPAPAFNVASRDYFTQWRDHGDRGVFIGAPNVSKIDGVWMLTVSRRISGSHGEFLGLVVAFTPLRYFEDFY